MKFASVLGITLLLGSPLLAQRLPQRWSSPTTLNVVLVTFEDNTSDVDDLPHGYTMSGGTLTPGATSYTLDDFERLFGVTGAAEFKGTDIDVAQGFIGSSAEYERLPEVFGSLRDYFEEISEGVFHSRCEDSQSSDGVPLPGLSPMAPGHGN